MRIIAILLLLSMMAPAQSLVLKDGRVVGATRVLRKGDKIVAESAPAGEAIFAITEIERIAFPEPPEIARVPELIVAGKGEEAIALIEPVVNYQVDFRELPGNWWAEAALRLAQALEAQERGLESQSLAEKISASAPNREIACAADVQIAVVLLRRGDRERALRLAERVLAESRRSGPRAGAFVVKGQCLLAEEKWEDAILSFLQVPVFYPGETGLLPGVILGRGRALLGMDDFSAARAALEELRLSYPASAEAKLALKELERVANREKGLAASR